MLLETAVKNAYLLIIAIVLKGFRVERRRSVIVFELLVKLRLRKADF
jgi:hypothetical protein